MKIQRYFANPYVVVKNQTNSLTYLFEFKTLSLCIDFKSHKVERKISVSLTSNSSNEKLKCLIILVMERSVILLFHRKSSDAKLLHL